MEQSKWQGLLKIGDSDAGSRRVRASSSEGEKEGDGTFFELNGQI